MDFLCRLIHSEWETPFRMGDVDMKQYKASKKWFIIAMLISFDVGWIIGAFVGQRALFAWGLFALCLLAIFLTPWRYYCACGTLSIDENAIMQGTSLNKPVRSIDRAGATVKVYQIFGLLYYAISAQPLEKLDNKQLLRLVRSKEAILYPCMPQLPHDFPALFARKSNA